jgi:arylsulfatase A-like enzyme
MTSTRLSLLFLASVFIAGCGGTSADSATSVVDEIPAVGTTPTTNTVPVANAGDDQQVTTGATVMLDGSNSTDGDGDTLTFNWQLVTQPNNSLAMLNNSTSAQITLTPDLDGSYEISLIVNDGTDESSADSIIITANTAAVSANLSYKIVDTGQTLCYSSSNGLTENCIGSGYDGDYAGNQPNYTLSGDGLTIKDNVTGLTWQQSSDINDDGQLTYSDKLSQIDAIAYCANLDLAGRDDWRLPSIKSAYSLIKFTGQDPSKYQGSDTSTLVPFIDAIFDWAFGDLVTNEGIAAGDRIIDAQYATTSLYVSTTMNGDETMFGVNYVDGRIKGYPTRNKKYYVRCVTDNTDYGSNNFVDNNDETVSDLATGLMWQQNDSSSVDFEDAISQCETTTTGNHDDWRLPNVKELHSLLDYSRSPDTTNSAAIDPIFNASSFTNEEGIIDWAYYWGSTTHVDYDNDGSNATYVAFGRALGFMRNAILDVHGAGAQRSNDKLDVATEPGANAQTGANGTYYYKGPQGDILRTNNQLRCVRDISAADPSNNLAIATDGTKNILLIIGDDIGVDNVSAYKEQINFSAQTPNIDALANKGVLFRNVWANPMCSPSRASILTGRYAFRHGVTNPGVKTEVLAPAEETIAEALSAVGYQTALFGKWHLGAKAGKYPTDQGFNYFSGSLANVDDYFNWQKTQINAADGVVSTVNEINYASEVVATEAQAWIAQTNTPWFVQLAFNAPHAPFHVPPASKYSGVSLTGQAGDTCTRNTNTDSIANCYRAAAEAMDTYIGELLNNIDAQTLANTLIIFVGDNGTTPEAIIEEAGLPFNKLHGKGTVYEGGVNVPLIIAGGDNVGVDMAEIGAQVQVQDLFSTILTLANTTPSSGTTIDGQSLIGYIDAQTQQEQARQTLYTELYSEVQSVDKWALTNGTVKYIFNESNEECYDLQNDSAESDNKYLASADIITICDSLKASRPQ